MEFIEMLKAEKRFLYELNTVAGEQTIKAIALRPDLRRRRVIAHTNEYEYNSYFGNKENEAMIRPHLRGQGPVQPEVVPGDAHLRQTDRPVANSTRPASGRT
jgi:hypothetical protein